MVNAVIVVDGVVAVALRTTVVVVVVVGGGGGRRGSVSKYNVYLVVVGTGKVHNTFLYAHSSTYCNLATSTYSTYKKRQ